MIYIDPPYNTGNDSFIYPDRFKEEKEDYEQRAGIKDAEGLLTKDGFWRKNSKDAGHFHSNWLSMMYPRLFLAKNLLREDGVIFVSIDDNEVHNLRMIMNEVFGEENFIDTICWKKKYGGGAKEKYLVSVHEYILIYAKSKIDLPEILVEFDEEKAKRFYKYKDEKFETLGYYRTHPLEAVKSFDIRKNLRFPVVAPDGTKVYPKRQWRWSKERFEEALSKNEVIFDKNKNGEWVLSSKQYLNDENGEQRKTKAQSVIDDIFTQEGTKEVFDIFGDAKIFLFPKPIRLAKKLIEISGSSDNDIILDFFAGSCATANSVMALNAEDGVNRKFICVQLAEPCEEESEAFKEGFRTIADIGKERIRRAANKIKEETKGKLDFDKGKLDLGFKVFKLDQSNFKQWRENVKTGGELKEQMRMFVDNVKKGSAPEDMLFEIILKNSRFDLNVKVEKKSFDGIDYYRLADGVEIVCLATKITKKFVDKVLSQKPERFTCLDIAFKNNDQLKTNTALKMESEKIDFKVI